MLNSIFYTIKHWVSIPVTMLTTPPETMSSGSRRGRALMLGIPAIMVAAIGVAAIYSAKYGMSRGLEQWYKKNVEDSERQKTKLAQELMTEIQIIRTTDRDRANSADLDALIPPEDPRRIELKKIQTGELVYLEKLISLNPDDMKFRYDFAKATMGIGEVQRGAELMRAIAPTGEPGYPEAHLWLASYFMNVRSNNQVEQKNIYEAAYQHADLCLKRDPQNTEAQKIKAAILYSQEKFVDAYVVYESLFDTDASFYTRLIELNKTLSRTNLNKDVYNRALQKFQAKLNDSAGDIAVEQWVESWGHVTSCLVGQDSFAEAERRLMKEVENQAKSGSSGVVKRVYIEQLLSNLFVQWQVRHLESTTPPIYDAEDLEMLKKAFKFNPTNPEALRGLTRIAIGDNAELSAAAREVYDPEKHADPPAAVLNELGSTALAKAEYPAAVRYFELARKKEPQNALILNNLAYVYLVGTDRNPDRALKLIDEAVRLLNRDARSRQVLSHFFDTRGTALMQLNRMTEAVASFEIALKDRPWNRSILESLVKCYEGSGLSPAIYQERIRQIDAGEAPDQAPASGVPNPSDK